MPSFPLRDKPRLWGVAVSHYQVEGGDECDWSAWERAGKTHDACGAAAGSWQLYEHDAGLARAAGANAFRFSVSWSRVEPRLGEYDQRALERYRRLAAQLVSVGLEPTVTLFHYTHPPWFHDATPWTSPRSAERFAAFARRVAEALGEYVRVWIPLNEPLVFLLAGFYDGQIPPALADGKLLATAFQHMLAAHVAAAAAIREARPDAAIGVAHNMMAFTPERPRHPLDRLLTRLAHRCYNLGLIEAVATGRWNFLLPPFTRVSGRLDELPRSLDFFGINFYSRLHLRCPGRVRFIGDFAYRDASGSGLTDNGWEIVPSALESLLHDAAQSGLPVVITENGLADAADARRADFLERHVDAFMRSRVPVHGYFHWSLLDNYEWLDGFAPRFGLYAVDRATMERTPRASVETFRRLGERFLSSGFP